MQKKPLADIVALGLKVLFVGYNPGLTSARTGNHYAHRSNRFWKLLHESGLTPCRFEPKDDWKLLELGFGSTNIVDRETRSENDISAEELRDGANQLHKLILELKPAIICYAGIGVYKTYASQIKGIPKARIAVKTGLQPEAIVEGTYDFVCYNTSGLNTIPLKEQLDCFIKLRELVNRMYC